MSKKMQVLSWDWKDAPDLDELARIVLAMSDGEVFITPVQDTGCDEYAIIIWDRDMDQDFATQAYVDHLHKD